MGYFVFVEGRERPKKEHETIESAVVEARRLAEIEVPRKVHVLKHITTFQGRISVQEVAEQVNQDCCKEEPSRYPYTGGCC